MEEIVAEHFVSAKLVEQVQLAENCLNTQRYRRREGKYEKGAVEGVCLAAMVYYGKVHDFF